MVTSNYVVFLFDFAPWSAPLPATCFWDSDFRKRPLRERRGVKTKQTSVIIDLEMLMCR